jgi:hypothetical protein
VRRPVTDILIPTVVFLLCACSSGPAGVLYDRTGKPLPEAVVRLTTIDDSGTPVSQLGVTITDATGHFGFSLDRNVDASVVVWADLPDGAIHGFFAGRGEEISVHPLTESFYSLVLDITSSAGGRSLTDFSAAELRAIGDAIFAHDWSGTSFTDGESLKSDLRTLVGRKIAVAAGGTIASRSTAALEGTPTPTAPASFVLDTNVCAIGELFHLLESSSFRFDVEGDGTICGGTSSSLPPILFDKAFSLYLPDDVFFTYIGSLFPLPLTPVASLIGDREIDLGPYSLEKRSPANPSIPEEDSITVARKIYVPASGNLIRYLEIFTNSGTTDRTLSVAVQTLLTTTNQSRLLTFDAQVGAPSKSDRFIAAYDNAQDRPTIGFAYQDGLGSIQLASLISPEVAGGPVNQVQYAWNPIVVPAGSTRTLLHFGYLTASRAADDMHARMADLVEHPDMTGLSRVELAGLLNFVPNRGTVYGDAGSVIGLATVTAVDSRNSATLSVTAQRDGSFAVPIDTQRGDTIHLTASDGLDTTITIP